MDANRPMFSTNDGFQSKIFKEPVCFGQGLIMYASLKMHCLAYMIYYANLECILLLSLSEVYIHKDHTEPSFFPSWFYSVCFRKETLASIKTPNWD